jgi:WD40 repeat protein
VQRFRRNVVADSTGFALSPRADLMAIGTQDGQILWWDTRTGRPLGSPTKIGGALDLAFSPDGRTLAVSSGVVQLFDVATRKRMGSGFTIGEKNWVPGIAFEPDGRLLIFGHTATTEWPTDVPTLQRAACRIAGRDLTPDEWRDLLPNRPYRRVCPH